MTIKRGGIAEPINANIDTRVIPQYCPVCERDYKVKNILHKRVYDLDNPNECPYGILPADHDIWLQCYVCGTKSRKDRVAQQGHLDSNIEVPKHTGFSHGETEHWEKPKHRRGFNERLDKEDDGIKDTEVKKLLRKGQKLLSYSER